MNYELTHGAQLSRAWIKVGPFIVAAFLLSAWDLLALDVSISQWFGNAQGFALRDHWFWQRVMHDAVRWPAWGLLAILAFFSLRAKAIELKHDARWALAGTLIAVMAVQWLKRSSHTSCPWDLQMFGGAASYVSHWAWRMSDGGPGRCFPAGHASVAFGFLPAWAALHSHFRRPLWMLAVVMLAGLVLGFVQVARGAHFVSHVLWSGWVCAAVAWLMDALRKNNNDANH
jgi:membrane-associated PAP2 superfamily phosphatase